MFLIAGCETAPVDNNDGGGEDTTGEDTTEPQPDEVVKPKSGLIVEGNVFDADTGTPVRDVIVRVLGFPKFASAATNNIGDFKLELSDEDLKEIGEDYNLFVDPNGAGVGPITDGNENWLPTLHGEVLFVKDGSKIRAEGTNQVVHVCPVATRGGTPGVWGGPSGLNVGETPTEAEAGVLARASIAILFVDVTKVADGFQFPDMVPGTTVTIDEDGTDYAGLGGYFAPFEEFVAAATGSDPDARSLDFDAKESNDLAGFLSMASPDPVDKGAVFRMTLTVENPDYLTTVREVRTGEGYQTVALFLMVPK
jgi:hypothetical protein